MPIVDVISVEIEPPEIIELPSAAIEPPEIIELSPAAIELVEVPPVPVEQPPTTYIIELASEQW